MKSDNESIDELVHLNSMTFEQRATVDAIVKREQAKSLARGRRQLVGLSRGVVWASALAGASTWYVSPVLFASATSPVGVIFTNVTMYELIGIPVWLAICCIALAMVWGLGWLPALPWGGFDA